MSEQHTHEVGDYDLEDIGAAGYGHIPVKVFGYWSRDSVSVYIRRKVDYFTAGGQVNQQKVPRWEIEMSHSAGGRDLDEEPDGLKAEANFGHALVDTATVFCRWLQTQLPRLEELYQAEKARLREEARVEAEQKAARVEADPALGEREAQKLLATATFSDTPVRIHLYERGEPGPVARQTLEVDRTPSGRARIRLAYPDGLYGKNVAKAEALQMLAAASNRSNVYVTHEG